MLLHYPQHLWRWLVFSLQKRNYYPSKIIQLISSSTGTWTHTMGYFYPDRASNTAHLKSIISDSWLGAGIIKFVLLTNLPSLEMSLESEHPNCKEKPSVFCSLVIFCNSLEELGVCVCGSTKTLLFFFLVFLSIGVFHLICFTFPDNGVPFCYRFTQGRSLGVQII